MHFLLIVEGEKAEPKLFQKVFSRYGFSVVTHPRLKTFKGYSIEDDPTFDFTETEIIGERDTIHIMQAPNNCVEGFLHKAIEEEWDLSKAFHKDTDFFSGKFIVFDVDHTPVSELKAMMDRYCDETDQGLLIVSSPCLEILSEPDRKDPIIVNHLRTYKKERNVKLDSDPAVKLAAIDYIIKYFELLMVSFLDANVRLFENENVLEHPALAVDEINAKNIRSRDLVQYYYFTTVIYVVIGYILGLTKQFENAGALKEFFLHQETQLVEKA